jgi:hypothetical protein
MLGDRGQGVMGMGFAWGESRLGVFTLTFLLRRAGGIHPANLHRASNLGRLKPALRHLPADVGRDSSRLGGLKPALRGEG